MKLIQILVTSMFMLTVNSTLQAKTVQPINQKTTNNAQVAESTKGTCYSIKYNSTKPSNTYPCTYTYVIRNQAEYVDIIAKGHNQHIKLGNNMYERDFNFIVKTPDNLATRAMTCYKGKQIDICFNEGSK